MKKSFISLCGTLFLSAFLLSADNSLASSTTIPPAADTFQLFKDIKLHSEYSGNNRASPSLYFLKKRGIIKGYPDGTIKIDQNINRAEFIKTVLQAKKGLDIYYDPKFTFADNPATAWYAKYLSTAKRLGIISGYPDGLFRPETPINYVEGLKILSTAFPLKPGNFKSEDNKRILQSAAGKWYYAPLKTALSQDLLAPGTNDYSDSFQPQDYLNLKLTREQAFKGIYSSLIASEFPIGHFESPQMIFNNSNDFLLMHPKDNFQIPIAYQNISKKAEIYLYRAPLETFFKGLHNSISYDNSGSRIISSDLISQMELLQKFEAEITPVNEATDPNSPYQKGYISLEISDPGLYFFVIENDYILPQHHFLDVTRNMILVKSAEKNHLIWLADYETQTGRSNINIDIYASPRESYQNYADGYVRKVSNITTDNQGIYLGPDLDTQYLIATEGKDISILQTRLHNRSPEEDTQKKYRSHIYTDRPVYRPGDTVYLKAIIRSKVDQNYELLKNETVTLKISTYGSSGEIAIFEKNYTPSSFSTISDEFKLNPEDPNGHYQIHLIINNEQIGYGQFEVQAYKKSEYEIEITPEKEQYFIGDTVKAKIQGSYFFGAPLKNQKINYILKRRQERYFYPMSIIEDYDMSMERSIFHYPQNEEIIKEGEAILDNNGEYTLEFSAQKNTDSENKYAKSITYILEVTSVDASNIPVTANEVLPVYLAAFEMEIAEKTVYPTAGQEYNLEIKTIDQNEKIYANAAITIKTQIRKSQIGPIYFNHWTDEYLSKIEYKDEYEDLETYTLNSSSQGIAVLNITPAKEGQYRFLITAQDSNNNQIEAEFQTIIHAASLQTKYRYLNQNLITITPDKDEYEVGDTATILVNVKQTPANILFVTAQQEILDFDFQNTSNGSQTISLPITDKMIGGLAISADVLHKYQFFNAAKQLKISPASKKLAITITPQKNQYRPQENSSFQITVKDNTDKPIIGELSLNLVDKAIFDILASNPESDILKKFYTENHYYLDNQSTQIGNYPLGRYAGAYYQEYADTVDDAEGTALGVRDMMATLAPEAPPGTPGDPARQEFLDTAYFNGTIVTDSNGQATISAKLPDNLTTWVADVIGVTQDTKVGQSSAEIIVNKDFFLSPHLPRFVTKGDRLTLRATARNQTASTDKFFLFLSGNGFTTLSEAGKQVSIPTGENTTAAWNIEVTGSEKLTLEFVMTTMDSNANDTVHLSLPVNLFGDEIVNSVSGEDQGEIPIKLQSGQIANLRSLIATLSPTLADNLIKSLEYLVGYPYGCVEQTMSKFLPNVIVYQNKDRLNLSNQNLFKDLPEQVQSGLKRLYNFQHSDGGWGWWETDETQPKNTAYVVYGLHLAKKAGFAVEEEVVKRGLAKIDHYLKYPAQSQKELSLSNKIYLNYVYTLASGLQHDNFSSILKQNQSKLKVIDRAYLALTLKILGDLEDARSHLQLMKASVKEISDRAYVEEAAPDYEFMQSSSLSTALALEALAEITPTDPLIPKIIRYINANSEEGLYHETHATAHAVIALASYLSGIQESDQALKYIITLNGQAIDNGTLDQIKKIEIPTNKLTGQNDILSIRKDSGSKLYFTVTTHEFINQTNIAAFNKGLELKRTYYDEKGNPLTNSIAVGSVVKIGLELQSSVKGRYLLIKDPLPAGFEPINPALSGGQRYYNYRSGDEWGSSTSHRDFLDDHTALFVDYLYPERPQTYYYYARAVTPGTFHLNPAKAEMMYMPEVSGGSGSGEIRIE